LCGCSLSHFLGRFHRSNDLTPGGLANAAGFGTTIIARWEKFRFNPPPSPSQLAAVAVVVDGWCQRRFTTFGEMRERQKYTD
jgi:hypothetical protein